MAKVLLTEKFIQSKQRVPPPGKRAEFNDALVPGLSLRVSDRGHRSFVLIARFPSHPSHPTRRTIAQVGAITLDAAREPATGWP
jgi:hypothetical protein